MKTILKIAKFQLSAFFYSPIAWLVLILFFIQVSVFYGDALDVLERFIINDYYLRFGGTDFLIDNFYYGIFPKIIDVMFLYIPLITMGLMSKEISSGTIKLLLSSPIKPSQIILGKYLAVMIYCTLMSLIFIFLMITTVWYVESADIGLIATAMISFILLTWAYSAIGLFISCLTSYQVVAALGTLAVLSGLQYVGNLWQDTFFREITYWLSLSGRSYEMAQGLITSSGIMYFLIMISLFLAAAIAKLSSDREVQSSSKGILRYSSIVVLALVAGYLTSMPLVTGYLDMTTTKHQTLSENSKEMAKNIKGPIKMKNYVNIMDIDYFRATPKSQKKDFKNFNKYKRFIPQLENEYIYFYDTIMTGIRNRKKLSLLELVENRADAENHSLKDILSPDEIRSKIDLTAEDNQFTRQISYNGKMANVRMFNDMARYPSENEINATLKQLVNGPAKVYVITGHKERRFDIKSDFDYQMAFSLPTFRHSLISHGFTFSYLDLITDPIPDDCSILVIADPQIPYDQKEADRIIDYINQGGNIFLTLETYSKDNLKNLTDLLGLKFPSSEIIQNAQGLRPNFVKAQFAKESEAINEDFGKYIKEEKVITTSGVIPIELDENSDFEKIDLIIAKGSYSKFGDDEAGLEIIERPIALALHRNVGNKQQRIIVTGDADFISDREIARTTDDDSQRNIFLPKLLFGWLTYDKFPALANHPHPIDIHLNTEDDDETDAVKMRINLSLTWIIPLILALIGSIILMRRRRK